MDAMRYATSQLEQGINLLNVAADGMTQEQYDFAPPGTCNAAAKSHVHALAALELFVLNSAKGDPMRWPETAQTLGLPANPLEVFSHAGTIPMDAIKEYGKSVKQSTLEYLGTLGADDLDRKIATRFGEQTIAWTVQLMTVHLAGHAGDIAAVKGIQGIKGLPF